MINGQVIEFEVEDEGDCEVEVEDGMLEVEAASLTLHVSCTDAAGNTATVWVEAAGLGADNDDESDLDDD